MRSVLGWIKSVSVVLLSAMISSNASAAVVVTFAPSGNDVVATVSGSWRALSGFGADDFASENVIGGGGDRNSFSTFTGSKLGRSFTLVKVSGPSTWGTSASSVSINADSGDVSTDFAFLTRNVLGPSATTLLVSPQIIGGVPITGSMTFSNKTMSSMGLDNYGTFVYRFLSTTETLTFVLSSGSGSGGGGGGGGGEVPEPTSMAIFGLGALGMACRARRKAKA